MDEDILAAADKKTEKAENQTGAEKHIAVKKSMYFPFLLKKEKEGKARTVGQ